jgi:aminodeoxyfutalosine deaminase
LYRKFKADRIFSGEVFLPEDKVLIMDEHAVVMDIVDEHDAGEGVELLKGILSPGFINCHCHLELSHLKGIIPKNTGLVDFVFKIVTERHFAEEEILSAIASGEKEMIDNGIVAVGDICNNAHTIPQKQQHNLWYRNFIETAGFPPSVAAQRFEKSKNLYKTFTASLPETAIVPHAPYSVSPALLKQINDFSGNNILTIHNQEIPDENELFQKRKGDFLRMYEKMNIDISFFEPSGKSSLQTFLPLLNKAAAVLLVHNVAASEVDIDFALHHVKQLGQEVVFCLCPNANLYISNILPDVSTFIKHNCRIVLGTDSLASNDQLSILDEMKTINTHFPGIELSVLLNWATLNGAKALGCNNHFGSFEKGKQPGLLLIEYADEQSIRHATVQRIW